MTRGGPLRMKLLLAAILATLTPLVGGPLLRAADPATAPAATATQPASSHAMELAFPTFGLRLTEPAGFRRMAEGAPNRIVQWTRLNPQGKSAITSMIYIEVEPALQRALKEFAQSAAMVNAGKLQPEPFVIDGIPAYRIAGTIEYKPFAHHSMIITQHEDQFYTISIMESPGDNCDQAVKALCDSIKWLKIDDVAGHLTELQNHVALFGKIELDLPAAMRSGSFQGPPNRAHWSLLNLKTNREELFVDFQLAVFDHRNSFEDVRAGYGQILKKRFALDADLVWKAVPSPSGMEVWITRPVEYSAAGPDGKPYITPIQWALVNVHTHVVVIVFNLGHRTLEQAGAYTAAVDRIVGTIVPADQKQGGSQGP
jgi:hypothetical protein